MIKPVFALIATLLLSSCSTMLLDSTHVLNIQSEVPDAKLKFNDSIYNLPANIEVKRSKKDLNLTLVNGLTEVPFKAKARLNKTFKYGNISGLYFGYFVASNYLIDLTNPKRFHYGKSLWLNPKDSTVTLLNSKDKRYKYVDSLSYYKHYLHKKGDVRIYPAYSYLNILRLSPIPDRNTTYGTFTGIVLGADYFHKNDQFLSAAYYGSTTQDPISVIFQPFTAFYTGRVMTLSYNNLSITNNHIVDRFSLGYGLNYGWLHYYNSGINRNNGLSKHVRYNNIGLSFPIYWQAGRNLHLGMIYNTSFYRDRQADHWQYEYNVGLNLAWKIRL